MRRNALEAPGPKERKKKNQKSIIEIYYEDFSSLNVNDFSTGNVLLRIFNVKVIIFFFYANDVFDGYMWIKFVWPRKNAQKRIP